MLGPVSVWILMLVTAFAVASVMPPMFIRGQYDSFASRMGMFIVELGLWFLVTVFVTYLFGKLP